MVRRGSALFMTGASRGKPMNEISKASEAKALPATTFIGRLLIRSVINDVEISVLAAPVVQRRGFAAVDAIKALDGDLQLVASAQREDQTGRRE